jgi:hypothetical protein
MTKKTRIPFLTPTGMKTRRGIRTKVVPTSVTKNAGEVLTQAT